LAFSIPFSPVAALAIPELITTALALPFFKISLSRITGAAQKILVVNTAAQVASFSE